MATSDKYPSFGALSRIKRAAYGCIFLLVLLPNIAHSQQIYQWKDAAGKTHFSTSPDHKNAGASSLPELKRENIDQRIQSIKSQTPQTCIHHGGIDCARGPDKDGSVVCLDGYDKAVLPFRFECLEARLEAEYLVELKSSTEVLIPHSHYLTRKFAGQLGKSLQINLRNTSGVKALDVRTEIRCGRRSRFDASGPTEVDAYGNASYHLNLEEKQVSTKLADLEKCEYNVTCRNCVPVRKAQLTQ